MSMINPIASAPFTTPKVPDSSSVSKTKTDFGNILQSTIESVNDAQLSGDMAIEKLQSGEAKHLHEVMLAVEEADISLRMLVQMRNKALTAYEEIMRMQI